MASHQRVVDAEGDIVLSLEGFPSPFAPWDDKFIISPKIKFETGSDRSAPKRQKLSSDASTSQKKSQVSPYTAPAREQLQPALFQVSSKHLSMASPALKEQIDALSLKEKPLLVEFGSVSLPKFVVKLGWTPYALGIVMYILHSRSRMIPSKLKLEILAEIALIVHSYQCYEAVSPYWIMWKANLQWENVQYGRDFILYLHISLVLHDRDMFNSLIKKFLLIGRGPIQTLNLSIHSMTTGADEIEKLRVSAIEECLKLIDNQLKNLSKTITESPKDDYKLFILGTVSHSLCIHGLLFSKPAKPFLGYSCGDLIRLLENIFVPFDATDDTDASVGQAKLVKRRRQRDNDPAPEGWDDELDDFIFTLVSDSEKKATLSKEQSSRLASFVQFANKGQDA